MAGGRSSGSDLATGSARTGGENRRLRPMDVESADHEEGSTMTDLSTSEPDGLRPQDTFTRAAAVFEFIAGHVLVQDELDRQPERDLAHWIAVIAGHVGRACGVAAERPTDADGARAAVGWLVCAGA